MQFAFAIDDLNYPTQPIYCPVTIDKPWFIFYATDYVATDSHHFPESAPITVLTYRLKVRLKP